MTGSAGSAIAALAPAIQAFRENGAIVVSQEKIKEFVDSTASNPLSAGQRLAALAAALSYERFDGWWRGLCSIYECALQHEPDNAGILFAWFLTGLDLGLSENSRLELVERQGVAHDLEKLLPKLEPPDPYLSGLLHYRHPGRTESDRQYLTTALTAFTDALKNSELEEEDRVLIRLYIGHCHFELGQPNEARSAYRMVDPELLVQMEPGSMGLFQKRIDQLRLGN